MNVWSEEVVVLNPPRVDGVTLKLAGAPEWHGFHADARGCWRRPGWRAVEKRGSDGEVWTRATAEAEALARGTIARLEGVIQRLDLCVDLERAPVFASMGEYFAGHRGSTGFVRSRTGATAYIASRRSHVFLRIYEKAGRDQPAPEWVEATWQGHTPDEVVTRVEFELKRDAVAGLLWPLQVADVVRLWRDAVGRLRMTARNAEDYAERNKAPTAPGWAKLGAPEKQERPKRARDDAAVFSGYERALARRLRRAAQSGVNVNRLLELANELVLTEQEEERTKRLRRHRERAEERLWLLGRDTGEEVQSCSEADAYDEESGETVGECARQRQAGEGAREDDGLGRGGGAGGRRGRRG